MNLNSLKYNFDMNIKKYKQILYSAVLIRDKIYSNIIIIIYISEPVQKSL